MAVERKLMTAEELLRLPDDGLGHELVRGELRTMPPTSWEHGGATSVFDASLGHYVRTHQLGQVVTGSPASCSRPIPTRCGRRTWRSCAVSGCWRLARCAATGLAPRIWSLR